MCVCVCVCVFNLNCFTSASQRDEATTQNSKVSSTPNQSKKVTTQESKASPTATQGKEANIQESKDTIKPTKAVSTISLASYIIYIAIAGAILVIVGYIAYHNRDYVSIVCDLLISIDHHMLLCSCVIAL